MTAADFAEVTGYLFGSYLTGYGAGILLRVFTQLGEKL